MTHYARATTRSVDELKKLYLDDQIDDVELEILLEDQARFYGRLLDPEAP